MISHLGPQLGLADGVALAEKLDETGGCSFVFTGDGGASEGDFHEAVNVAAVWQLPVIIGIENNAWGLSTPSEQQFKSPTLRTKPLDTASPRRTPFKSTATTSLTCTTKWPDLLNLRET